MQVHFDLTVSFDEALPVTSVSRSDDASVYTGGQTSHQVVSLAADDPVYVRDTVPTGGRVVGGDFDHVHDNDDRSAPTTVVFTRHDGDGTTSLGADYFAEAPEGSENTGPATFGPIEVSTDGETWIALSDTTDQNVVVGQST